MKNIFLEESFEKIESAFGGDPKENHHFLLERERNFIKNYLASELALARKEEREKREPLWGIPCIDGNHWGIPCGDGNHNSFWKSIVLSPEWKAWEKESNRRFSMFAKTKKDIGNFYDVDECRECGWISEEHIKDFFDFTRSPKAEETKCWPCKGITGITKSDSGKCNEAKPN